MLTITATAPMTPGTYLRKRREAAELSIRDVALLLADDRTSAAELEQRIGEAESDGGPLQGGLVGRMLRAFGLDVDVYLALSTLTADPLAAVPVPQICRVCACSWNDACEDPQLGPCAWVDGDSTLCTHCVGQEVHHAS